MKRKTCRNLQVGDEIKVDGVNRVILSIDYTPVHLYPFYTGRVTVPYNGLLYKIVFVDDWRIESRAYDEFEVIN